jgi:hypothetical protein
MIPRANAQKESLTDTFAGCFLRGSDLYMRGVASSGFAFPPSFRPGTTPSGEVLATSGSGDVFGLNALSGTVALVVPMAYDGSWISGKETHRRRASFLREQLMLQVEVRNARQRLRAR